MKPTIILLLSLLIQFNYSYGQEVPENYIEKYKDCEIAELPFKFKDPESELAFSQQHKNETIVQISWDKTAKKHIETEYYIITFTTRNGKNTYGITQDLSTNTNSGTLIFFGRSKKGEKFYFKECLDGIVK